METLDGTEWDVVISGTGLSQSLLALSLSRSGKRILHLDKNDYYGGDEAALSLSEATAWAERYSSSDANSTFTHASVIEATADDVADEARLKSSRAYSLALAPHLLYARSALISAIVSSQTHNQLDFQAVGSWFILEQSANGPKATLTRVPSGREDVFLDKSFNLKAKRSLMTFLRFVANYEEQADTWKEHESIPFPEFLEQQFKLPSTSHGPILALTMTDQSPNTTTTGYALPRIARYLRSIGVFGPGFGAVLPKWGGLAEIVQVACRACAVGGGVYVLNKGIDEIERRSEDDAVSLKLSGEEEVSTKWLVGTQDHLPNQASNGTTADVPTTAISRSTSIVSSPLPSLFPPTSEGGVTPAGAVVVVPSQHSDEPPVHILVHTSDAGECPMNQSVLYASTLLPEPEGFKRLNQAVAYLLESVDEQPTPSVLWNLQYEQRVPQSRQIHIDESNGTIVLPPLSLDAVLEDIVLDDVKKAWQQLTGESEETFMVFEARDGMGDDEE